MERIVTIFFFLLCFYSCNEYSKEEEMKKRFVSFAKKHEADLKQTVGWLESLHIDTGFVIEPWKDISLHYSYIDTTAGQFGSGSYFSVTAPIPKNVLNFLGNIASFMIFKEKHKLYYRFRVAAFYNEADILVLPYPTSDFSGYKVDSLGLNSKTFQNNEKWIFAYDKQIAFVNQ